MRRCGIQWRFFDNDPALDAAHQCNDEAGHAGPCRCKCGARLVARSDIVNDPAYRIAEHTGRIEYLGGTS